MKEIHSSFSSFFPRYFAFAESDSTPAGQAVRRHFYTQRGKHFLLAGVPWRWVQSQPKGSVVIDPSTAATTTEDVWLEGGNDGDPIPHNKNGNPFLIVGKAAGSSNYAKKRTVIKFDVASAGIPSGATVVKAQMNLKYFEAFIFPGVSWVDRTVQAHRLLVDWAEAQATSEERLNGVAWSVEYGAIDDTDAKAAPESSVLFAESESLPRWKRWDLTDLTRQWHSGAAANYGVLLWATNEDTDGADFRFHASEATSVYDQPYLEIIWTQPVKTVYFLKDHLGSIRATVDELGQVVGYDDYDPWGFILAGRSMATGASTVQGAAKNKFTGKEYDDEFGLNWYHFDWRPYDPETGRWTSPDPLAEKFPGWSPYNYTLNNPVNNFDPDGREVRFSNRGNADSVATYLNTHLEGADIRVEERTGTNKDGEEFTYFALAIGENSIFDFGSDALTKGLFDVITSKETVFNIVMQTGGLLPGKGGRLQEDRKGGFTIPFGEGGGATIYLDRRGQLNKAQDYVISDVGIVFMHETVGHGSPFFENRQAVEINERFSRFNPPPAHGGYLQKVKWKGPIGLWPLSNYYPRYLVNRKRALIK